MDSEREDSIRQGIHPPEESPSAQEAAEEKRKQDGEGPEIGGGMGGTSDADTPADEALYEARRHEAEAREAEESDPSGEAGKGDGEGETDDPPPPARSREEG